MARNNYRFQKNQRDQKKKKKKEEKLERKAARARGEIPAGAEVMLTNPAFEGMDLDENVDGAEETSEDETEEVAVAPLA